MKTCYIFGAAQGNPQNFTLADGDLLIAADAGFLTLRKMGITPHITVGDFDSLGQIPHCGEVIRHPVKKDDTDSMLAIKIGLKRGYRRFVLYGCTGQRLDHTLANIQALSYISKQGAIGILYGDDFAATAVTNGSIAFSADATGTISLFSAGECCEGVNIKGLLYPLTNGTLTYDFPLGISNEFIGKPCEISIKKGTLTAIWYGSADLMRTDSMRYYLFSKYYCNLT